MRRCLVLLVAPLLAAACGGSSGGESAQTQPATAPATTVVTTVTTSTAPAVPQKTALVVYFLRGGRISPTRVTVDRTRAVAHAALHALAGQAPRGYSTAFLPPDDVAVTVDGGVAKVDWPHGTLSHEAAAQVVYTLTEFPTIRAVELPDGTRARRAAFEDVVPPIVIETPLPGDDVRSPIPVAGTASVFEATLVIELVRGGQVLQRKTVTASTGAPERGTFSTSFVTNATGKASIVAFSPSAADGSEQHRVEVPVRIVG